MFENCPLVNIVSYPSNGLFSFNQKGVNSSFLRNFEMEKRKHHSQ